MDVSALIAGLTTTDAMKPARQDSGVDDACASHAAVPQRLLRRCLPIGWLATILRAVPNAHVPATDLDSMFSDEVLITPH